MTGQDVVSEILQIMGITQPGETPAAADTNSVLTSVNNMLCTWSADLRPVFCKRTDTYPLVGGVARYTVGPTGDFNQPRPNSITAAQVKIQGDLNYPLKLITPDDYAQINLKTLQGIPSVLAVNPTMPNTELFLYYVPLASYDLVLTSMVSLDSLSLLSEMEFPPGYQEAVIYNGAVRAAPKFGQGKTLDSSVIRIAYDTFQTIARQNDVMTDDQMSPDMSAPGFGVVNFPWWWTGGPNPG